MIRRTTVCVALSLVFAALGCSGSNTTSSDAGGTGGMGTGGASGGNGGADSSGAGNSSAGAFSPSVSGSEQLGNLSPADTQKLCDDLKQYVSGAPFQAAEEKFSCGVSGLLGALSATEKTDVAIQTACQSAYDDCLSTLKDMPPTTTDTCQTPDASCTATVAEYTACLNDSVKVFDTTKIPSCASLTADNVTTALLSLGSVSQKPPASCAVYEMKCPMAAGAPGMPDPGTM